MKTLGDVIDVALRRLRMRSAPSMGTLGADMANDPSATTLTTAQAVLGDVGVGDLVQVAHELMYVTSSVSTTAVTVIRGYADTTMAAHTAGDHVEVNPRFSREDAMQALVSTVRSWKDLFWVEERSVTMGNDNLISLNIPGAKDDIFYALGIRYQDADGMWVAENKRINIMSQIPGTGSASSSVIQIDRGMFDADIPSGTKIYLYFARPFPTTQLTEATSFTDVMRIPQEYEDIMVFGIMWRLLMPEEGINQDTDSWRQSREVQDVPPGAVIQTASVYRQLHDQRVGEEEYVLSRRWGWGNRV